MVVAVLLPLADSANSAEPESERIRFEGNEQFDRRALLRALSRFGLTLGDDFAITQADDAAYFLREFYLRRGFPGARVEYDYDPRGPSVRFTIEEGLRVFVGRMEFEGGELLGGDRLRDIVTAAIRQATNTPIGRLRFVRGAVDDACERIRQIYAQKGYLDAQVSHEAFDRGDEADLMIHIDQGPLYTLRSIRFLGAPEQEALLRDAVEGAEGNPFTPDEELLLRTRLLAALRNAGFYRCRVEVARKTEPIDTSVELVFTIETGPPYRIGRVTVRGNRQTRKWAILRRFAIREGDPYDAERLDESTRRLWFSGAFSEADAELSEPEAGVLDVELDLREAPAKHFGGTVGYGEWERAFGELHYTDRNFLGTLLRFSVRGLLSQRSYGAIVELADPWFLGSDTTGLLGGYFYRTEQPAYRASFLGGLAAVEGQYKPTRLTGYRIEYRWQRTFNADIFALEDDDEDANINYTIGSVGFSQILDRRNDMLAPMQGFLLRYDTDLATRAFLGDLTFYRLAVQATAHIPFQEITPERPFVPFLTLNHRAGIIVPFADTGGIPVPERYFLGGPTTVRSFQYDGMPPRDRDGDPLGGEGYLLANVEYQHPIWRLFYGAVFVDAGNIAPRLDAFTWSLTRVGLGAGVRVYTPVGAIRVDYGYNLIRGQGDPIGAWQFGFGFTF